MAANDLRVSLNGKFLYDSPAGSTATTESTNVDNVELNVTVTTAKTIKRGQDWEHTEVISYAGSLSVDIPDREGDALTTALIAAFAAKTPIAIYAKDTATGAGLDGDFSITGMSRSEVNDGIMGYTWTFEPHTATRQPSFG